MQETGHVSDRVLRPKPPQCRQPKTDAGGTRWGQSHRGALSGYDSERDQSRCLGSGPLQAQRARFSAGSNIPRAAAQ